MSRSDTDTTALFAAERPRLIGLAYRLLGSVADAEDVVQEAWVRWDRTDRAVLINPQAWLTTVVSRLGIDRLRARQRDRTHYVGPWLPEPIVSSDDDPAARAELSDSLTTAFLVMLERLSPDERLVLLLADVFQQPFPAVAEVIGKTAEATRQLAVRARRKVRADHDEASQRRPPSRIEQLAVADEFVAAILRGDEARVRELLAPNAVLVSDGGALHHAARRPVLGPDRIGRFLLNLVKRIESVRDGVVEVSPRWINGSPGMTVTVDGRPRWVAALDVNDGYIDRLFIMVNPDKLGGVDHEVDLV